MSGEINGCFIIVGRPIDANMVAMRIVGEQMGDKATDEMLSKMSSMIRSRMTGRGFAVASNDITGPMIEQSFQDGCKMLEEHFKTRSFYLVKDHPLVILG